MNLKQIQKVFGSSKNFFWLEKKKNIMTRLKKHATRNYKFLRL